MYNSDKVLHGRFVKHITQTSLGRWRDALLLKALEDNSDIAERAVMKVVSFKICPFVQRVTALLDAKNISYDIEYINLSKKPDWFLAVSPNAQVPILITDQDEVLFESNAIVEYLEETTTNSLFSKDPVVKAHERAWSYLASKNYLIQCSAQRSKTKEVLTDRSDILRAAFQKLEKRLSGTKFFGGESIGMVDISWLPLLHRASIVKIRSGFNFLRGFPKLQALQKNILTTGIAQRSVAADFEQKFTAFYLSNSTYLGRYKGALCHQDSDCDDSKLDCCA